MSIKPLISFCIPTYNRASYLKKCIESIRGYQGDDIEIVIRNNASVDETEDVVNGFNDARIRYFRNETNRGAKYNVCKVLEDANGEYTFCLTDDDMLIPGSIDRIKLFITEHDPECFKCDLIAYLEKSKKSFLYSYSSESKYGESISNLELAGIFNASHIFSGLCFRSEKLDNEFFNMFRDNYYPSMALMASFGKNVGYIAEPLVLHIWENELFWDLEREEILLLDSEKLFEQLPNVYPIETVKEIGKIFCKQNWWLSRPSINLILTPKEKRTYRKILPAPVRAWGIKILNRFMPGLG